MIFRHRWRLIFVLAFALPSLTSCGLFSGDEEVDPPAELIKFEPSLRIKKLWSAGIGDDSEGLRLALAPAADGSRVFAAAHDGRVAAFEAESGKRLWLSKTRLPLAAGPAVDGERVVLGSSDGDVIALDADDGAELWRVRVSSEVLAAPALTPRLVLIRTVDGKLLALDAQDGRQRWFSQQSVPRLSVRGTGAPVAVGNTVVAGFDNGKVVAFDLSDGSPIWESLVNPPSGRTEVDRLADLNSTVSVAGDDVYATAYQGRVSALARESGEGLWVKEISSYNGLGTDFINVYVTDDKSEIHALARRSGREMWRAADLRNRDATGPAVVGNSVVVGDFEGYVHWFSASTGKLQARVRAGGAHITSAPVVFGGIVYVLTDAGKLYAYRERPSE